MYYKTVILKEKKQKAIQMTLLLNIYNHYVVRYPEITFFKHLSLIISRVIIYQQMPNKIIPRHG